MHTADIQAAIKKHGHSCASIGRQLGVTRRPVSAVVLGKAASRRIAQYIADLIGLPIETLWPGKYDLPRQTRKPRNPHRRKAP